MSAMPGPEVCINMDDEDLFDDMCPQPEHSLFTKVRVAVVDVDAPNVHGVVLESCRKHVLNM